LRAPATIYVGLAELHRRPRDITELIEAITVVRRLNRPEFAGPHVFWGWIGITAASVLAITYVGDYYAGVPVP
jgi:hypothetical protein